MWNWISRKKMFWENEVENRWFVSFVIWVFLLHVNTWMIYFLSICIDYVRHRASLFNHICRIFSNCHLNIFFNCLKIADFSTSSSSFSFIRCAPNICDMIAINVKDIWQYRNRLLRALRFFKKRIFRFFICRFSPCDSCYYNPLNECFIHSITFNGCFFCAPSPSLNTDMLFGCYFYYRNVKRTVKMLIQWYPYPFNNYGFHFPVFLSRSDSVFFYHHWWAHCVRVSHPYWSFR